MCTSREYEVNRERLPWMLVGSPFEKTSCCYWQQSGRWAKSTPYHLMAHQPPFKVSLSSTPEWQHRGANAFHFHPPSPSAHSFDPNAIGKAAGRKINSARASFCRGAQNTHGINFLQPGKIASRGLSAQVIHWIKTLSVVKFWTQINRKILKFELAIQNATSFYFPLLGTFIKI